MVILICFIGKGVNIKVSFNPFDDFFERVLVGAQGNPHVRVPVAPENEAGGDKDSCSMQQVIGKLFPALPLAPDFSPQE